MTASTTVNPSNLSKGSRKDYNELTVQNAAGRALHVLVIGDPQCGRVVFYNHGFPACRLEALLAMEAANTLGLCVVAIDRPGMGGSEWYRGRRLQEWPTDVACVADALGVERFAVLGVSGGAPSAVATAAAIPERVVSLTVVSGLSPVRLPKAIRDMNPVNKLVVSLSKLSPRIGALTVMGVAALWKTMPKAGHVWIESLLPSSDTTILSEARVAAILGRAQREALHRGVRGVVSDYEILMSRWEDCFERVTSPTTIWHGSEDTYVPHHMGTLLHTNISNSTFKSVPGGHFIMVERMFEVLSHLNESSWPGSTIHFSADTAS